jgi:hypothetical protein
LHLLGEGGNVGGESDGVVDEKLIEVAFREEELNVGHKEVIEVDGVDHSVEALAEGLGVILETGDDAERERLPVVGLNLELIHINGGIATLT